ncbi:uncharacterized protein LOC129572953 [Sitodiplosis mosellana]|uniref:uncharacterized protein LOC129572953 n=1 Tax=Sitodiplosis mosellana TaxID=263140 RepID=UPI002443AC38|nr:uncharacterized protein LOC129572953 [Sitodiplosis mosellana]XP_055309048.1 uncharacterized protein LOC129572953 [Sitodiplosis mosellana]
MSCPTVKYCLCFINLKLAGILLGVIDILWRSAHIYLILKSNGNISVDSIFGFYKNEYASISGYTIVAHCICIPISVLWLIGIFTQIPALMVPSLVVSFISFFLLAFLSSLFWFTAFEDRRRLMVIVFICFCIAAFCFHLWIVQLSLYKSLKSADIDRIDQRNRYELRVLDGI